MKFIKLAETFRKIESTTKRTEITKYLSELMAEVSQEEISKAVYLIQGKLFPDFIGIEIGMAEKLVIRAIAIATGLSIDQVAEEFARAGDLGDVIYQILLNIKSSDIALLTLNDVYSELESIAKTTGPGSVESKLNKLAKLLQQATPIEAKYITRIVTKKLRLGLADMTILDVLAIVYGGGAKARPIIEHAYNITSDLGPVAEAIKKGGLEILKQFKITPGKPIRPMLAERLKTPQEIFSKMEGNFVAEYKYDGERVQIHKVNNNILLFSRRLENITHQYPDVIEHAKKSINAKKAIVEAEIVAYSPETGELRPFQELMRRRRKYGVKEMAEEFPASVFFFDCLFWNDIELVNLSFMKRREALEKIITPSEQAKIVEYKLIRSLDELEEYFEKAVQDGTEGLICKSIGPNSVYRAGSRGWLWIKYKREYLSEMTDTVDLVVVGAYYGKGKRAGVYGSLLLAAYSPNTDTFKTITKLGAGFTDKDLQELPKILEPYKRAEIHPRVEAKEKPDIWFVPSIVLEVRGAEITLSPLHTAGLNYFREGSGLAIRFPRFTGRYRFDKSPEDATTEDEIIEMYQARMRKVA